MRILALGIPFIADKKWIIPYVRKTRNKSSRFAGRKRETFQFPTKKSMEKKYKELSWCLTVNEGIYTPSKKFNK